MAHDWGSNIVTIQGNGTVRIITVTKHLEGEVKRLKVFSIGTISLPKTFYENRRCEDHGYRYEY